ncbi:MAG TPA: radical SAM protein [Polyangiaceae bacterium]|nr:radical SAM protein [Polyangiaceae bacterium]
MLALQALTPGRLADEVPGLTLDEARKLVSAVHRDKPLDRPFAGVRRASFEAVRERGEVPSLELLSEAKSSVDPFRKFLFRAPDGAAFEAVRIPLEKAGRFSVCVSSQAGCALACAFCATGRLGLRRNLSSWEIVEQVRWVRRSLDRAAGERVHGVVFQGMGEPLANVDRVLEAIAVFSDPCALAVDARNITVCTAGLPAGIRRLAAEAPRVRLALSIGSARPELRRSLMPIEKSHALSREVFEAAVEHARATGLVPLWAYAPLAGVNDTDDDARALGELVRAFADAAGVRPRVSLIPYNAIGEGDPFARQGEGQARDFREALARHGVFAHIRYSGGGDVAAACGQLAARGAAAGERRPG